MGACDSGWLEAFGGLSGCVVPGVRLGWSLRCEDLGGVFGASGQRFSRSSDAIELALKEPEAKSESVSGGVHGRAPGATLSDVELIAAIAVERSLHCLIATEWRGATHAQGICE